MRKRKPRGESRVIPRFYTRKEGDMSQSDTGTWLSLKDIQDVLWAGRALELNSQWQRSVMVGTFLALSYAGYGALMVQEGALTLLAHSQGLHWQAFGVALLGIVFAYLWTCMAKGSKSWFETYEAAIELFGNLVRDMEDEKIAAAENAGKRVSRAHVVAAFAGFNHWDDDVFLEKYKKREKDASCLTTCAGRFSPSKINIVIGIFSLGLWMTLAVGHLLCLSKDIRAAIVRLLQGGYAIGLAAVLLGFILGLLFIVFHRQIESSTL